MALVKGLCAAGSRVGPAGGVPAGPVASSEFSATVGSAEVDEDLEGSGGEGEHVLHGGLGAALDHRGLQFDVILAPQVLALEGAGLDRAGVGGDALRVDVDREAADAGVEVGRGGPDDGGL